MAKMKKKPVDETVTIRKRDEENDFYGPELPLPFRKKLFVEIIEGLEKGKVVEFSTGRLIIGRRDADLVLEDQEVSKKHAVIEAFSRDNIYVRDLASTNGTYVNGVQVNQRKITDGDILKIGTVKLKFYTQDSQE